MKMMRAVLISVFLLFNLVYGEAHNFAWFFIDEMKCDFRINPLGIEELQPNFSWTFSSIHRNQYQTAFRIIVSSSRSKLEKEDGDIWDSGKIFSPENINVPFNGVALKPFTRYFWKIKAWNQYKNQSRWSKVSVFETAFLRSTPWQANWIGEYNPALQTEADFYKENPAPIFSKSFQLPKKKVLRARLYISGLGYYEAYINKNKTGTQVLDPGWTNYSKTVLYSVYDVTKQLHAGNNCLQVLLGNGWYNPLPLRLFGAFNLRDYLTIGQPKLAANLRITFNDGSVTVISTDSTWKTNKSFILKNNIYLGETQDGRLVNETWNATDMNKNERFARTVEAPVGTLRVQTIEPIRITKKIPPITLREPQKNVYVFDMGQNFAGWVRMKLHAKPGTVIHYRYGELLFPDGHVNGLTTVAGHIKGIWNVQGGPGSPKTAYQEDSYICRGDGTDIFQPHFTFHAFRYVEINGLNEAPALDDLIGLRLNSDLPIAGHFICNDTLLNQIQQNTVNTFLSNIFSVQSDCPGRERQGYGADMVSSAEAFIYNFDMSNFYSKTVQDFANDARPNGGMPECAPYNGITTEGFADGAGPLEWQLAFSFLQQQLYLFYGNKKIIADNYEKTKAMVEFLRDQSKDYQIDHGIGDHVSIDAKHISLTSGAFYYYHVKLLSGFASILGKKEDSENYQKLADTIALSFNRHYLDENNSTYDTSFNQITQVFPIWNELVPERNKDQAFDALISEIKKKKGHFSTGIFGTKMLFDVLRKNERNDLALSFARMINFPSYGYMIKNGATTLWETWEKPDQNSWNHPMFGSVSEWFYRSLPGINQSDDGVGFNKIILKPFTGSGLSFVKGYYKSIRGKIVSNWIKTNAVFHWDILIPANIKARIYIPALSVDKIMEGNQPVEKIKDLTFLSLKDGYAIFEAVSGSYHFIVK